MESVNISTAETLTVLAAMSIAADSFEAEANRSCLKDIKKMLKRRADRTRTIAANIKSRALAVPDFAREFRAQETRA